MVFVVITESADQILGELENMAQLEDTNITLPSGIELVLEMVSLNNELVCGYYFVEHTSRCLFWLEEFDAEGICNDIIVVQSRPEPGASRRSKRHRLACCRGFVHLTPDHSGLHTTCL